MITRTQYNYSCVTKTGLTKSLALISNSKDLTLWDNSMGQTFKTINEAEIYMCVEFQDVLLISKSTTTAVKIEKPIQLEVSIGKIGVWCQCDGVYATKETIFCPKCNNPIP
jgi:hypothetical protein